MLCIALNNEQIRFDKTVFANEMDAQAYESTFVHYGIACDQWNPSRFSASFRSSN